MPKVRRTPRKTVLTGCGAPAPKRKKNEVKEAASSERRAKVATGCGSPAKPAKEPKRQRVSTGCGSVATPKVETRRNKVATGCGVSSRSAVEERLHARDDDAFSSAKLSPLARDLLDRAAEEKQRNADPVEKKAKRRRTGC